MKKKTWFAASTLFWMPLLFSCCSGGLPSRAITGYNGTNTGNAVTNKLQGVWDTDCTGSSGNYNRMSVLFSGYQFSFASAQYSDSSCTQPMYQLTIGKGYNTSTTDPSATTISLQTTSQLNQMYIVQGSASSANSSSLCGQAGWQDATSVDVSGDTCLGVSVPSIGATANETVTLSSDDTTLTYNGQTYTKEGS